MIPWWKVGSPCHWSTSCWNCIFLELCVWGEKVPALRWKFRVQYTELIWQTKAPSPKQLRNRGGGGRFGGYLPWSLFQHNNNNLRFAWAEKNFFVTHSNWNTGVKYSWSIRFQNFIGKLKTSARLVWFSYAIYSVSYIMILGLLLLRE